MAMTAKVALLACTFAVHISLPRPVDGAHIFGVPNMNFYSHSQVLLRLGHELVKRGHDYTHVIPDISKEKSSDDNITFLTYKSSVTPEQIEGMMINLAKAGEDASLFFRAFVASRDILHVTGEDILFNKQIMDTINATASLILCDMSNFVCPALADALQKNRVDVFPVIVLEPFSYFAYAQPLTLVTMPSFHSEAYLDTSFMTRLNNALVLPIWYFVFFKYLGMEHLWRRFDKRSSDYNTAVRSASMVIVSNDFAVEFPRSLPAHVKVVGPILPKPPSPLPAEYQVLLEGPTDTLIAAFGTIFSHIGNNLAQTLADGFAEIPLNVIWKHTGKLPQRIGNNTKVVQSVPQNDLLGNGRVKMFFTHGGGNSFFESVYHGVPMICMPLFGDQYRTAALVKGKKIGIVLRKEELTVTQITWAAKELLENPAYLKNVKEISGILRDRKNTPAEEGADWIEYVLRHDGAKHLRNPLIDLPFYQEYMLDVFLFLGIVVFIVFYLNYLFLAFVCRKCLCRGSKKPEKEKIN